MIGGGPRRPMAGPALASDHAGSERLIQSSEAAAGSRRQPHLEPRRSAAAAAAQPARCTTGNAARAARAWPCPVHRPTSGRKKGVSRPGSFRTKIESAAGNRTLPSNTTKASQVAERVIRSPTVRSALAALPRPGRNMQGLATWCRDQRGTSVRQIRQPQGSGGWGWRRVKRFVGKPPIELFAAAIARRRRCLVMAFRLAARARKPNMKMVIVAPPRPNLRQPRPVRACLTAQRPLDRRVDKDPCHFRLAGDGLRADGDAAASRRH